MNQETLRTETPSIDPCAHMQERVSALADGSLTGAASWYTRWHVFHCSRCATALKELRALLERVRSLKAVTPGMQASTLAAERRAQLMAAMDSTDNAYKQSDEQS